MGRAAKGKQKAAPNSGSSASSAGTKKKDERRPKAAAPAFGDALERELAAVGLRVQRITADGNCMFRAAADQMHGDEDRHAALRQRACDLMEARREEFEPFVEDDESFDAYLKRMRKVGGCVQCSMRVPPPAGRRRRRRRRRPRVRRKRGACRQRWKAATCAFCSPSWGLPFPRL
jgi:hypothetical protein